MSVALHLILHRNLKSPPQPIPLARSFVHGFSLHLFFHLFIYYRRMSPLLGLVLSILYLHN